MRDDNFKTFVEQVRSAANIVDVVGSYVSLRKKGNKHWACCPFHGEKTPSFSVDENKQLFYCFGCHIGGDVFKFVEKKEGLTFAEAAKRLAERYSIPVPEREKTAADLVYEKEFQKVVNVNEWANKYYVACLNHPRGAKAKEYLLNRGITTKIIDAFQIGYALPGYENLVGALPEKGIRPEEILFAGLSVEGRQGQPYDKFRDRVMIPIKNPRGKIVGFGGRVIGQGEPKYLNTAETKFFNKRNLLFAFDLAQKPMREKGRAIVVEGYMDAISLHAAGLDNVVASMGTAFSEQQADLLKRNTKEIVFCYDSDNPGRNASVRAVSIARKIGVKVRVATVPGAKDPDEYIRQEGLAKYLQVIDGAMPGLQFQIKETVRQGRSDS
ncbi:MAG: DNA primase, partial [Acidaminococcaceae bacterium]|nr:DNA primase [Acidaminococcaceae bacterium]